MWDLYGFIGLHPHFPPTSIDLMVNPAKRRASRTACAAQGVHVAAARDGRGLHKEKAQTVAFSMLRNKSSNYTL